MNNKNNNKGYSLLELLVYVSLFVLISIVIIQSLIFIMKTYANANAYRNLQQNGDLVLERMVREIRSANSISTGSSTFGSSPGVLSLSSEDTSGNPYTASFSTSNGIVNLSIGGVSSAISSNQVSVSSMIFRSITTATTDAVKIDLTLSTTRPPIVSAVFNTTVILRE